MNMNEQRIDRTFKVEEPAHLKLGNIRGIVNIQPGDQGVIEVSAIKHQNSGNHDRTSVVITQDDDGQVQVHTKYEHIQKIFRIIGTPCKVDYLVRIPRTASIELACVSSMVIIGELEGSFDLKTVSGRLILSDLQGDLSISSVSGDVNAREISGSLQMNLVSADGELAKCAFTSVKTSTVSGDIFVGTSFTDGPYTFKSVSGDVDLFVPAETGYKLKGNSFSGYAEATAPGSDSKCYRRHWEVALNGGGPEVRYRSHSGNIRVVAVDE
jgi:hypothetical protein